MNSTLDFYNHNAEKFVEDTLNADMSSSYNRFLKYLKSGAHILDLGCGSGRDTIEFRRMGFAVTPVDGSRELCNIAESKIGMPVRCVLFENLDYHEKFDAVWACASLLHVSKDDISDVISRVEKALKPSGILYASYKYGINETVRQGRLFNNYTEDSIEELFCENRWIIREIWISDDVRPERQDEKWINIVAEKHPEK